MNAKSNDSTKISKLQKLSDDAKQYEDKAKQYEDKAKKYINKAKKHSDQAKWYSDEIIKLVETSKEPSKPNIDTSKIMNTDKGNITDEALKVSDNSDSIDEKIANIEKENRIVIYNNTADTSNDTSNDSSDDTKPNIDEKTLFQVYETEKTTIKGIGYHEVRKTTWIFWKSRVSELSEKWVRSAGNYAYTWFEHVLVKYFLLMSIK